MIVISLLINPENSNSLNMFYILLIILGFYELVGTYVRTGLAIYLVALAYIFLQNLNMKKVLFIIASLSVFGAGSFYIISTSEVAQMRFEDRNKYVKNDEVGSGRLTYWKSAVENWSNDEDIVILIGLGEMYAEEKMEKSVGLKIFAHNEFFQMLQQEGLIGFSLFLSSLFTLYSFIKRHKDSKYYQNSMAIFIGMITMMMFQGGFYFNIILFLSIYLALQKLESLEQTEKELINER
jgi:O-antigen ligase